MANIKRNLIVSMSRWKLLLLVLTFPSFVSFLTVGWGCSSPETLVEKPVTYTYVVTDEPPDSGIAGWNLDPSIYTVFDEPADSGINRQYSVLYQPLTNLNEEVGRKLACAYHEVSEWARVHQDPKFAWIRGVCEDIVKLTDGAPESVRNLFRNDTDIGGTEAALEKKTEKWVMKVNDYYFLNALLYLITDLVFQIPAAERDSNIILVCPGDLPSAADYSSPARYVEIEVR